MNAPKRHLFLTGEKQVGKSTLLWKLAGMAGSTAGFRTVRTNEFLGGRFSVHMLAAGKADQPGEENLLFVCRSESPEKDRRFDALGCALLADTAGAALIVMDELGPNERGAKAFQHAVLDTLDGDTPVLGVLQKADCAFLRAIAGREDVCVVEVTPQNRETLYQTLSEEYEALKGFTVQDGDGGQA